MKRVTTDGTQITEDTEWNFFASHVDDDGTETYFTRSENDVDKFLEILNSSPNFTGDIPSRDTLLKGFCTLIKGGGGCEGDCNHLGSSYYCAYHAGGGSTYCSCKKKN